MSLRIENFIKMVQLRPVDPRFLHCYLIKHGLKPRDLDLSQRQCIRNTEIAKRIKNSYTDFKKSNLDLEQFFDCQIVEFMSNRQNQDFWTNCEEITHNPIFLCFFNNNPPRYKFGIGLERMNLTRPIKMSLSRLLAIYKIDEVFRSHDFDEIALFENRFNVNLHFYHLDDSGQGKKANDLPPPNDSGRYDIYIGLRDGDYYWTSKSLCMSTYYCSQNPGQCTYQTDQHCNLTRHMSSCQTGTSVTAKQVISKIIFTPFPTNIFSVSMVFLKMKSISLLNMNISLLTSPIIVSQEKLSSTSKLWNRKMSVTMKILRCVLLKRQS